MNALPSDAPIGGVRASTAERGSDIADTSHTSPTGADRARAALIASATRLLGHKAPGAITMQEVADGAGVNKGLVHRHFGSKAALFVAVMRQIIEDSEAEIPADAPTVEVLFAPIRWIVETPALGRILIWLTAEEVDPALFGPGYPLIERAEKLLLASGATSPRQAIAFQMSAAYGWSAFEANMMHALDQDQVDQARGQFLAYARSVLERELGDGPSCDDTSPPTP